MTDGLDGIVSDIALAQKNSIVGGPFGSNLVSNDYVEMGVPVIRGANMGLGRWVKGNFAFVSPLKAQELSANIARPRDILFTQRGTVGQVAVVPDNGYPEYVISQSQMKLTPDPEKAHWLYLYYYFSSPQLIAYMQRNAIQTGVPHTNLTILKNTPMSLPSLAEQHAIAHILSSLDDKIELNRQMNETLEATARAIFKSWFVDFDPVYAKMNGEQPVGVDAETAALFPDSFEPSELGDIPSGWRLGTLGDDFKIIMGQSPPSSTYNEEGEGLPFYQGRRDFGNRYPSLRIYCNDPKRIAEAGDTLVSVRAPVGDINMANRKCCIGRGVASVRHLSDSRSYTYYSLLSLTSYFNNYDGGGTVFNSISGKDFKNIPFILPLEQLVNSFHKNIASIDELIKNNFQEVETLTILRDILLPKLISGKIRVSDAEDMIES